MTIFARRSRRSCQEELNDIPKVHLWKSKEQHVTFEYDFDNLICLKNLSFHICIMFFF